MTNLASRRLRPALPGARLVGCFFFGLGAAFKFGQLSVKRDEVVEAAEIVLLLPSAFNEATAEPEHHRTVRGVLGGGKCASCNHNFLLSHRPIIGATGIIWQGLQKSIEIAGNCKN